MRERPHPMRRQQPARRRWRDYRTAAGGRPVNDFLLSLPSDHRAEVASQMGKVRRQGSKAARHLRGEIFEVRVFVDRVGYRVLFAEEGRRSQILPSLEAYRKQGEKTPEHEIDLAERRLRDWRGRARRYTK